MEKIIKSYHTTGLCGTCYRELLATIEYRSDGAAYITKTCPNHGYEEAMVERDYNFWDTATQLNEDNRTWQAYNDTTIIEITDHCNLACTHCYHMPDNKVEDLPAEFIIAKALSVGTHDVTLMGAEPTMREDLAYIIKEIKTRQAKLQKSVSIYTNGLKLKDKKYLDTLLDAGLDVICLSVHHPEYHKESIWKRISVAFENIAQTSIQLGQVSFTCENKKQVGYAIDKILWFIEKGRIPGDFCIRSPAQIGVPFEQEQEIYISDLFKWVSEIAEERGLEFSRQENGGSNVYHVACTINGCNMQLIHWGTVKSIDTGMMYMGPYAQFIPNTTGMSLIQAILKEGMSKGWWQGKRLVPENVHNITFTKKTKDV